MLRTLLRVALLLLIPAAATFAGLAWWLQGGRYASTENAYVKSDIVKIAPEVTGTVKSLNVEDHGAVKAGDVLLQIDSEPFEIALDQAEAELDAARQQVETLRATFQEARSTLAEAESRANYYEQRAGRHSRLAKRGVVSTSKLDEIQNDANAAGDKVKMVRRRVDRALAGLGGKPNRPTDLHPLVRAKKANYDQA
ncbi:MAG: HlyD family secretion protein, partial [Methyloligellaceae bacterium]